MVAEVRSGFPCEHQPPEHARPGRYRQIEPVCVIHRPEELRIERSASQLGDAVEVRPAKHAHRVSAPLHVAVRQELSTVLPVLRVGRFRVVGEAALYAAFAALLGALQGERPELPKVVFSEADPFAGNELEQVVEDRPGHRRARVVAETVLNDRGQGAQVTLAEQSRGSHGRLLPCRGHDGTRPGVGAGCGQHGTWGFQQGWSVTVPEEPVPKPVAGIGSAAELFSAR